MATALTPLAASLGLPVLLIMRACMGVGEGVAMPAMNNLLSRYTCNACNQDTAVRSELFLQLTQQLLPL